ncbi:MAG TPA: hypothetical protein VMD91_05985 [Candidatus Sulfotelmatobacter sp.]|nr:hypothetical protein [Candidatus Sulfotelmatobacter sp.]
MQFLQTWAPLSAVAALFGVLASLITGLLGAHATALQNAQTYNSGFEKLLQETVAGASFTADPQRSAMTLLALQDLAQTERQKETVLLIAARMVHASSDPSAVAAAARTLAVMLNDDRDARNRPAAIDSRPFFALVTSGYATSYFEDNPRYPQLMATALGDSPVTSDAEVTLLDQLGGQPPLRTGWIHLATFSTRYRYGVAPAVTQWPSPTPAPAGAAHAPGAAAGRTAVAFVADMVAVAGGDLRVACDVREQFAIALPRDAPAPTPTPAAAPPTSGSLPPCSRPPAGAVPPLIGPASWVSPAPHPTSLLVLAPRLLHDAPPVVMVNPDGTFMRGTLGQVRGVIPAGTCVDVDQDVRPVLVFVEEQYIRGKTPAAHDPNHWTGLIHLWAHVTPARHPCAFPTPAP